VIGKAAPPRGDHCRAAGCSTAPLSDNLAAFIERTAGSTCYRARRFFRIFSVRIGFILTPIPAANAQPGARTHAKNTHRNSASRADKNNHRKSKTPARAVTDRQNRAQRSM